MVDIVGVNNSTTQPSRVSDRTVAKTNAARKREDTVSTTASDRLDISAGVKEAQVVKRLVQTAQTEPDIRPEEVSRAKERLDNGEYNGVEVSRQTAKKILGFD